MSHPFGVINMFLFLKKHEMKMTLYMYLVIQYQFSDKDLTSVQKCKFIVLLYASKSISRQRILIFGHTYLYIGTRYSTLSACDGHITSDTCKIKICIVLVDHKDIPGKLESFHHNHAIVRMNH